MKQNSGLLYIFLCIAILCVLTVGIYFSKTEVSTQGFILKEYNGCIAVFTDSGSLLNEIPDSNFSALPENDKEKLKNGIFVASEAELQSLIEDFSG